MNVKFALDGCYELEIRSDGNLITDNACAHSPGSIGIQVLHTPLSIEPDRAPVKTVAGFFLKCNQARAIASAMLSAVSEAKGV